jgi:hypothetical protein
MTSLRCYTEFELDLNKRGANMGLAKSLVEIHQILKFKTSEQDANKFIKSIVLSTINELTDVGMLTEENLEEAINTELQDYRDSIKWEQFAENKFVFNPSHYSDS